MPINDNSLSENNNDFLIRNYIKPKDNNNKELYKRVLPDDVVDKEFKITEKLDKAARDGNKKLNNLIFKSPRKNSLDVLDIDFIRSRFGISDKDLSVTASRDGRYFTTAIYKYSDTSLGGHLACNTKPQYTRYADIRHRNRYKLNRRVKVGEQIDIGMGRYYSEVIDDNAQLIYMSFGVKRFNGLLDFFMSAIDYRDQIVANTGRAPLWYDLGNLVAGSLVFMTFPITSLLIYAVKFSIALFSISTNYNFYYMEPAMHLYWGAVNTIVTQLATEIHLVNPWFDKPSNNKTTESHDVGMVQGLNEDEMTRLGEMFPGLYKPGSGYLDVYGIAARPQAIYRNYVEKRKEQLEKGKEITPVIDSSGAILDAVINSDTMVLDIADSLPSDEILTMQGFINDYVKGNNNPAGSPWYSNKDNKNVANDKAIEQDKSMIKTGEQSNTPQDMEKNRTSDKKRWNYDWQKENRNKEDWWKRFQTSIKSIVHDGAQYAIFQVDYVGTTTESFSNMVGDIETGGMLKSVSAGVKEFKFNFAHGNLGLGMNVGAMIGAAQDTLMGALNGATFNFGNVLATILGDSYIDIQKHWKDSEIQLPQITYNLKLRPPYGNPFTQMQSMYIPLAMLLAGVLPLATGKVSYTSPLLCSIMCQGVQNIKMGMITSLSITRGTSNLPFTKSRRPLGIDVSFTVTDFSNLFTAPVTTSLFANFGIGLDDDSSLGRYLATIGGRDLQTDKYFKDRLGMKLNRFRANIDRATSPHTFAYYIGGPLNTILAPFTDQGNFNINVPTKDTRSTVDTISPR